MHPPRSIWIMLALWLSAAGAASAQWVTDPVNAPGVEFRTFHSRSAGATVSYHIYLPPQYHDEPCRRFPVLYWLHGAGGGVDGIPPLSSFFGDAIVNGTFPPMLVVFPNGMNYSMWSDSADGAVPMESVVINDLVPEVDGAFRTFASRRGRIIEGFSMGGYGAARLGFEHHERFAGVSILGAGPMQLDFLDPPPGAQFPLALRLQIYAQVWDSDPQRFLAQSPWMIAERNAAPIVQAGTTVRLAVGQLDPMVPPNLDFRTRISDLGIQHEFRYPPGIGHQPMLLLLALSASNQSFYRSVFDALRSPTADLNADGVVDADDFFLFLQLFATGDPIADINTDGVIDAEDFFDYLKLYAGGC
ncbi:MAG: esterase family protein [Phycisphaerales bacterium]|nr:MAG: esterase family protein [Phycisphaerales bacterium]